jgi:hypothetical protein
MEITAGISSFSLLLKVIIPFIRNGFQPFGRAGSNRDMLKPTVFGGTVPMFYTIMRNDDIARFQMLGRLAVFLIPTFSACDQ